MMNKNKMQSKDFKLIGFKCNELKIKYREKSLTPKNFVMLHTTDRVNIFSNAKFKITIVNLILKKYSFAGEWNNGCN